MSKNIRITHRPTGLLLAEGPLGWGITPFEGNYYIAKKHLRTDRFKPNFIPGICPYKFLYVWMDLLLENGSKEKNLGWMYWLPAFPFHLVSGCFARIAPFAGCGTARSCWDRASAQMGDTEK